MAEHVAGALAMAVQDAGSTISAGRLDDGVRRIDELLPRVERLVTFAAIAEDLVRPTAPDLARRLGAYARRILEAGDRLAGALDVQDFVAVAMTLELALAPSLAAYGDFADEVVWALEACGDDHPIAA